jgi:hypothetical protein
MIRSLTAGVLALAVAFTITTVACADPRDIQGAYASADGNLRIEFRPDGTWVEDYMGRTAAYSGTYVVDGRRFTITNQNGSQTHRIGRERAHVALRFHAHAPAMSDTSGKRRGNQDDVAR